MSFPTAQITKEEEEVGERTGTSGQGREGRKSDFIG